MRHRARSAYNAAARHVTPSSDVLMPRVMRTRNIDLPLRISQHTQRSGDHPPHELRTHKRRQLHNSAARQKPSPRLKRRNIAPNHSPTPKWNWRCKEQHPNSAPRRLPDALCRRARCHAKTPRRRNRPLHIRSNSLRRRKPSHRDPNCPALRGSSYYNSRQRRHSHPVRTL